jgi:hypothetical protein
VKSVQVHEYLSIRHAPALNSIQHAIFAKKTSLVGSALISHVLSKGQIPPKKSNQSNRGLDLLRRQVNCTAKWFVVQMETGNSANYYKCVTFLNLSFLICPHPYPLLPKSSALKRV